jgi:hypothetical protein
MVAGAGLLATAAFAAGGRLAHLAGMLLLALAALVLRGWTLQRIDAQQEAWQAGDRGAMRRLRLVHWGGMTANVLVLVSVASSVRFIL